MCALPKVNIAEVITASFSPLVVKVLLVMTFFPLHTATVFKPNPGEVLAKTKAAFFYGP